jgi:uncharacterized membrane protein
MQKTVRRVSSILPSRIVSHFDRYTLGLVILTSVTAILSFLFLQSKSFWYDEVISVAIARSDWSSFWYVVSHYEVNMSLYYFLLHLWANLGQSEFFLRSLSVIFSILTIPAIYLLGSRLFDKRVALLSALLMSFNAFFIRYAQEARSYSLLLLLATLSSYLFVSAVRKSSKKVWAAYIIVNALAMYAHVFIIFVILAQIMSLLFLKPKDIPWKGLLSQEFALSCWLFLWSFTILLEVLPILTGCHRPILKPSSDYFGRLRDRIM